MKRRLWIAAAGIIFVIALAFSRLSICITICITA